MKDLEDGIRKLEAMLIVFEVLKEDLIKLKDKKKDLVDHYCPYCSELLGKRERYTTDA